MSVKEKARCKAIVVKIRNGVLTLEEAKIKYNLTEEMCNYIVELLNENVEA